MLLKNWSFPCAIAPTYWAHPGRTVAGSRLPFSLPGSWCLPSRNGRNVTPFQSLQWCVQGDKRTKWPVLMSGLFVHMPSVDCSKSQQLGSESRHTEFKQEIRSKSASVKIIS